MDSTKSFFKTTPWGWREMNIMLFLIFIFVPIVIEFALQETLLEALNSKLYAGTATGLVMALAFTSCLYFFALRPKGLKFREFGVRKFEKRYWKSIVGWTIILIVTSVVLVIVMDILFNVGTENAKTKSIQSQLSLFSVGIAFLSAAVISPLYEEILYRGFLYRFLRSKFGVRIALFISSTVFMLVHIPTYNTLPVNFISGLIFAWTYEKSGSILPAILIHGFFNGIAVLLTVLA